MLQAKNAFIVSRWCLVFGCFYAKNIFD